MSATTDGARLILGRIYLEQYRRSADQDHLMQAREALRAVNTQGLDRRERVELAIGLGEALFLDDKFGPAAELLERALDSSADLGPEAHERLLDWWASTVDRLALTGPRDTREAIYARIVTRMEKELAADPGSAPASYWLAAAARRQLTQAGQRRRNRALPFVRDRVHDALVSCPLSCRRPQSLS